VTNKLLTQDGASACQPFVTKGGRPMVWLVLNGHGKTLTSQEARDLAHGLEAAADQAEQMKEER
jgi:hypothetical protein